MICDILTWLRILGNQYEERMDGYGGKTLRKEKFYDESGKNRKKGQQAVEDHSMTIQKSWVMMKDRTDKELKELVEK